MGFASHLEDDVEKCGKGSQKPSYPTSRYSGSTVPFSGRVYEVDVSARDWRQTVAALEQAKRQPPPPRSTESLAAELTAALEVLDKMGLLSTIGLLSSPRKNPIR